MSELNRLERMKIREASCEAPTSSSGDASLSSSSSSIWSMEEVQLLVKAVTMFPAGTVKRWEAIALFVNTHSPESSKEKNSRMVISKVKNLQKLESGQKESLNKQAYAFFEKQHQPKDKSTGVVSQAQAAPSERYGTYSSELACFLFGCMKVVKTCEECQVLSWDVSPGKLLALFWTWSSHWVTAAAGCPRPW